MLLLLSAPLSAQHYINDSITSLLRDSLNRYRASKGLNPVRIEPQYKNFADKHSYYQSRVGFITHGIGVNTLENRVKRDPYMFDRSISESVALVYYSDSDGLPYLASKILLIFKGSKPHNSFLISPEYDRMYVSCYQSGEDVYITLLVGK